MKQTSRQKRVVIVDDSRTILAMLEQAFNARPDFLVVGSAKGAAQAVDLIRKFKPDLVTIDLCMPYIDGAALLSMLLDTPGTCKIVVSTNNANSALLSARLKSLGAAACIDKNLLANDRDRFFLEVGSACQQDEARRACRPIGNNRHIKSEAEVETSTGIAALDFGYPIPVDEKARLNMVRSKGLTNLVTERSFDLLTRYLSETTRFPMCFLNFIDADTVWMKSSYGIEPASFPREEAFCSYTIGQYSTLIVKDATKDKRFAQYPSVTGEMHLRTYVGQPIIGHEGTRIGALCVADQTVRTVTKEVTAHLSSLSKLVAEIINCRPDLVAAAPTPL